MRVVLLKEVKNLGRAGDIKDVSEGYALNYLVRQNLAEPVTRHTATVLEAQKKKKERLKREAEKDKKKLARRLNGQSFAIKARTDDKGTLYAGVDAAVIAKELAGHNIQLEPAEIRLEQPIKKTGEYVADIKMAGETARIHLRITSL